MADTNRPMNPLESPSDDPIDRALREALDVSPSPDFVARVRMRVANEPRPRRAGIRWTIWMPVTAGALVAAAIVVLVVVGSIDKARPEPAATAHSNAAGATDVHLNPDMGAARLESTTTAPTQVPPPLHASAHGGPGISPAVARHEATTRASAQPEVLVSQAEMSALRSLLARASREELTMTMTGTPATVVVADDRSLLPLEITISLITIDPLIAPVNGEEGVRQ